MLPIGERDAGGERGAAGLMHPEEIITLDHTERSKKPPEARLHRCTDRGKRKLEGEKIDGSKNILFCGVLLACALAFTPASFQESVIETKKDDTGSSSTPAAGIRQSTCTDCTLPKILYAEPGMFFRALSQSYFDSSFVEGLWTHSRIDFIYYMDPLGERDIFP